MFTVHLLLATFDFVHKWLESVKCKPYLPQVRMKTFKLLQQETHGHCGVFVGTVIGLLWSTHHKYASYLVFRQYRLHGWPTTTVSLTRMVQVRSLESINWINLCWRWQWMWRTLPRNCSAMLLRTRSSTRTLGLKMMFMVIIDTHTHTQNITHTHIQTHRKTHWSVTYNGRLCMWLFPCLLSAVHTGPLR